MTGLEIVLPAAIDGIKDLIGKLTGAQSANVDESLYINSTTYKEPLWAT